MKGVALFGHPHGHVQTMEYEVVQGSHEIIMHAVSTPYPTFVRTKALQRFS
jgi:hypothetical protein